MSFGSCRVLSPDDFEVDDQQKSTTKKIEQSWNLTSPQPPTYRYFYHDDARIRGLVRERFRYFFPLGSENQQPAGENLDYMNQFGTRAHMDSTESSKKRGKKSTTANAKVGSHATGGWVNPKSRASIPKDVGKRIVSAGTNQSGRWLTGQDGRKVYVTKDGQELIGRIAYMNFKKPVSDNKYSSLHWEDYDEKIDMATLSSKEPILFYDEVVLYEDELSDSGVSLLTVKVRVMPSCWFLLLRFWLRVDGALMRLRDTRVYCSFGSDHRTRAIILRDSCWREATVQSLSTKGLPLDSSAYTDPNQISQMLPVLVHKTQKLNAPWLGMPKKC